MRLALSRTAPLLGASAALAGWWTDPRAFLNCYLVAWWFCLSLALGVLANAWLHRLTGGAWGAALRAAVAWTAPRMPLLALLFLPVLLRMQWIYPQAGAWFVARAASCLLLWSMLAWTARSGPVSVKAGFAALALISYGLSLSVAAADWLMSLTPQWYSSVFGLLCGTVQMMAGMALAIVLYAPGAPALLSDLGKLLLMYVLCWAYLEYVQYLIIWSANLPREILWYLPRAGIAPWLALFLFAVPLLLLLQRRVKRDGRALRALAWLVLGMVFVHTYWLVLPGLDGVRLLQLPLAALALGGLLMLPQAWQGRRHG